MNILLEKGIISELSCGSNFAYLLNDNSTFQPTEYKVLQNQGNSSFVRCMKMQYNGKTELYYLTSTFKPFSQLIPTLDPDGFITVVSNLLNSVIEVRKNGFLSCQKIDISFEKIYIEPNTYKVILTYLPINQLFFDDVMEFENELRTGLIRIINSVSTLSSQKTTQLSVELSDGKLTIDDLYNHLKGRKSPVSSGQEIKKQYVDIYSKSNLRLIAMNAPTRVEIDVTKDEFVIGKKPELCDGIVSFNKMISRSHCKILRNGTQFSISDLQSANGTYVNGKRILSNQVYPINNGDIVRLANSDFQVVIS